MARGPQAQDGVVFDLGRERLTDPHNGKLPYGVVTSAELLNALATQPSDQSLIAEKVIAFTGNDHFSRDSMREVEKLAKAIKVASDTALNHVGIRAVTIPGAATASAARVLIVAADPDAVANGLPAAVPGGHPAAQAEINTYVDNVINNAVRRSLTGKPAPTAAELAAVPDELVNIATAQAKVAAKGDLHFGAIGATPVAAVAAVAGIAQGPRSLALVNSQDTLLSRVGVRNTSVGANPAAPAAVPHPDSLLVKMANAKAQNPRDKGHHAFTSLNNNAHKLIISGTLGNGVAGNLSAFPNLNGGVGTPGERARVAVSGGLSETYSRMNQQADDLFKQQNDQKNREKSKNDSDNRTFKKEATATVKSLKSEARKYKRQRSGEIGEELHDALEEQREQEGEHEEKAKLAMKVVGALLCCVTVGIMMIPGVNVILAAAVAMIGIPIITAITGLVIAKGETSADETIKGLKDEKKKLDSEVGKDISNFKDALKDIGTLDFNNKTPQEQQKMRLDAVTKARDVSPGFANVAGKNLDRLEQVATDMLPGAPGGPKGLVAGR